MDGVSAVLQGDVIAIDVGGEEDFRVPSETLAGGKVRDQARGSIRVADVNDSAFLLGDGRAQEALAAGVQRLALAGGRRGRRRARVGTVGRRAGALGRVVGVRSRGASRNGDGGRHGVSGGRVRRATRESGE